MGLVGNDDNKPGSSGSQHHGGEEAGHSTGNSAAASRISTPATATSSQKPGTGDETRTRAEVARGGTAPLANGNHTGKRSLDDPEVKLAVMQRAEDVAQVRRQGSKI